MEQIKQIPGIVSIIMDCMHGCPKDYKRRMLLELNFIIGHTADMKAGHKRIADYHGRENHESPFVLFAIDWIRQPDDPTCIGNKCRWGVYGSWLL